MPQPTESLTSQPQSTSQKLKVFISYGREEITNKFAVTLHGDLTSNGYECTLDVKDFKADDSLSGVISDKIDGCDAFIIILSKKYSQSDWYRAELVYAKDQKKKLIVIKREECVISSQVQFLIEDRLYFSFINDEEYNKNLIKLLGGLEKV